MQKPLTGVLFFPEHSMNKNHHKQQEQYFNKEFSSLKDYALAPWQKNYIDRIKKYMLDKDYKKKVLLDIGPGSGYVSVEMAKLGIHVIACDLSSEAVEKLKQYKKKYKLAHLEVIHCKAEEIPLKTGSVDYIVANAILEHIPAEKDAIKKWKSLLKKNGKMLITVPLQFRYIWPFLWLPNFIHDKKIGHLRRYDFSILKQRFNLPIIEYSYTGHLVKIIGMILSLFTKNNSYDNFFEELDKKKKKVRYGANNISVIFKK